MFVVNDRMLGLDFWTISSLGVNSGNRVEVRADVVLRIMGSVFAVFGAIHLDFFQT